MSFETVTFIDYWEFDLSRPTLDVDMSMKTSEVLEICKEYIENYFKGRYTVHDMFMSRNGLGQLCLYHSGWLTTRSHKHL